MIKTNTINQNITIIIFKMLLGLSVPFSVINTKKLTNDRKINDMIDIIMEKNR